MVTELKIIFLCKDFNAAISQGIDLKCNLLQRAGLKGTLVEVTNFKKKWVTEIVLGTNFKKVPACDTYRHNTLHFFNGLPHLLQETSGYSR